MWLNNEEHGSVFGELTYKQWCHCLLKDLMMKYVPSLGLPEDEPTQRVH